jgi:hypothetical protein
MDGWIYYYHRQKFVTKYVVNTDKKEKHGTNQKSNGDNTLPCGSPMLHGFGCEV